MKKIKLINIIGSSLVISMFLACQDKESHQSAIANAENKTPRVFLTDTLSLSQEKASSDTTQELQEDLKTQTQNLSKALAKVPVNTQSQNSLFGFTGPYSGKMNSSAKYYLADFWATWCGPCRAQSHTLSSMHKSLLARGVQIIGVSDEELTLLKKFETQYPHEFPQFYDPQGLSDSKYSIASLPTLILFDQKGKELKRIEGESTESEILAELKVFLK